MGWQLGEDSGMDGDPVSGPGAPGASDAPRASNGPSGAIPRDERLAGFTPGGGGGGCAPGPERAAVLAAVAGPDWRCPGADPDELIGVLRRLVALESWA